MQHPRKKIRVPRGHPRKGTIKRPEPPEAPRLIDWLPLIVKHLSVLASTIQLLETFAPELYVQLAIEFWNTILTVLITAINIFHLAVTIRSVPRRNGC
jgi:hypothetical protein